MMSKDIDSPGTEDLLDAARLGNEKRCLSLLRWAYSVCNVSVFLNQWFSKGLELTQMDRRPTAGFMSTHLWYGQLGMEGRSWWGSCWTGGQGWRTRPVGVIRHCIRHVCRDMTRWNKNQKYQYRIFITGMRVTPTSRSGHQ